MSIEPLELVDVRLSNDNVPLQPKTPEFEVRRVIVPLIWPGPLLRLTLPPNELAEAPEVMSTSPPEPKPDKRTDNDTKPAWPDTEAPDLIRTRPESLERLTPELKTIDPLVPDNPEFAVSRAIDRCSP